MDPDPVNFGALRVSNLFGEGGGGVDSGVGSMCNVISKYTSGQYLLLIRQTALPPSIYHLHLRISVCLLKPRFIEQNRGQTTE